MTDDPSIQRHRSKRIAIFNHKGGVGKTTLTANIAFALGTLGKRVLVVDADPQCNLTSYFVEDSVVDGLLDESDGPNGNTIWSAVKPLIDSDGPLRIISPIQPGDERVSLLPGDIRLSEFEEDLGNSWTECFKRKPRGFRCTAALSTLVNAVAKNRNIDYVFYDSGPNIGALNRVVLLDCDCFIVPAACDLFSLRALKTLGHALVTWIRDWETIATLAPDGVPLVPGKPAFLGYIPQRFRVYGGTPTVQFSRMMPRLERQVSSEIVARLQGLDPSLASGSMRDFRLGQVKDFPLAGEAQRTGVAMWAVKGGDKTQCAESKEAFLDLAREIIRRV